MAKVEDHHHKAAPEWQGAGFSYRQGYAQALADADARIVAWLRDQDFEMHRIEAADAIERGDHYGQD